MNWQPTISWENAKKRAEILQKIRHFFALRNVLEVETPTLSQGTVTDVYLDALTCQYNFLANSSDKQSTSLYLQTSPEFHMKRLLASGYGCIYQIAKAFRHEPYGKHHNPEFTMLEWYRIGFNQFDLMSEVSDLLKVILDCKQPIFSSYQNMFIDKVSIDPLDVTFDELKTYLINQGKVADWLFDSEDKDQLLQFIFTELIEPTIGEKQPHFVYNFPVAQASLAKVGKEDHRVAERFECYYQGIELVNGFNELTDAKEQRSRFNEDNNKRADLGLPIRSIDENFITALEQGLPQCAGVALGIDRLIMLALKAKHIENVQTFSIERA